jgi:hypothetical protein
VTSQQYLNEYFSQVWATNSLTLDDFEYTGKVLVDKVKESDHVLDVGCGRNLFKGWIRHLVGIDPAFDEADHKVTLEQFASQYQGPRFDVAFCLGSINFGSRENIENQIAVLSTLLKDHCRVYWRCNPGLHDHRNEECKNISFYPWSFEEHVRLSQQHGFELTQCQWDKHQRIYAEWKR